ncbi:uncharacterized protein PITG_21556 [Phytophthora infestans T30-4]|uniref:Uncharacterized protein n=1 Tax=Phytophthora infestans (strain T30-4) TaxID=403677 RepID=D0P448_PHYIT|nr:uncharacterized protein PITG_21556 [Phytophthora infestans T30-4]EEY63127.1 conserved hypothetical protein [Phytophthora infestans T30-4]|eukprot:XP_002894925.1 conserved hypothetical protein [Phytophthora infestans T30-4]
MYPTLRMEKDDSSDEDYIVDTEDSEDDEVISGDTDDPLILDGKKRRQSPHQLFVNRRYSSHEPVPSNKKLKVMVDEGPKAQSDEKVKQGDAQVIPKSDQEKEDNGHNEQDEYHSDGEGYHRNRKHCFCGCLARFTATVTRAANGDYGIQIRNETLAKEGRIISGITWEENSQ